MPQLDYMLVADYVRQDGGAIHIMGAGVDTIFAPVVPTVQPLGVALRVSFDTTEEAGVEHHVKVTFVGPDHPVLEGTAQFATPPRAPDMPAHWRSAVGVALQIPVPLPSYGDYSCELDIDDGAITRSYDIRVMPRPNPAQS